MRKSLFPLLIILLFIMTSIPVDALGQSTIYNSSEVNDRHCLDPCPSSRKLVRLSNGTMFATFYQYGGDYTSYVYRSCDNGSTWTKFYERTDTALGIYDMSLGVDSQDNLHLSWALSPPNAKGLQHRTWNATDGWSSIYNVTSYNTDGPEDPVMAFNSSDAMYFFYYNTTGGAARAHIRYKIYYNGVWSGIQDLTTQKVNTSDYFIFATFDSNDVCHIVWFTDAGDTVDYCNLTDGVRSNILHLAPPGDGDCTSPCIVADNNNNLSVSWLGRAGGADYYIRQRYYWFANQTWSGIRNIALASTDGSTYPYPTQTVDQSNTVYVISSGSAVGNEGQRYWKRFTNGTWTGVHQLTTNYKTTNNFALYQYYPIFNSTPTMRPISGFSCLYWNDSSNPDDRVSFFNESALYSINSSGGAPPVPPATPAPDVHHPGPTNGSINQQTNPTLNVTATGTSATWYSNSSGSWIRFANDSFSGTNVSLSHATSNFSNYETTYWWAVNVSNGTGFVNRTYHFTTESAPMPSSWWNNNWLYCKKIYITNPLLDYVTNITIHNGSGTDNATTRDIYCNDKCKSDFGDLRMVSQDNSTEIPYWIATNISYGSHCELYFNNSQNDSYVWLYYGNPLVSTTSNGDTTLLLLIDDADHYSGSTPGWSNTTHLTMNGSFLRWYKPWDDRGTDEIKSYNLTTTPWKNYTIEYTCIFDDYAETLNHNLNMYTSETSNPAVADNITATAFYHRTQAPIQYGYKYTAGGAGNYLYYDTAPFDVERTYRADINGKDETVDYYLHQTSNDTYFASSTGNAYADAGGGFTPNFVNFFVPGNDPSDPLFGGYTIIANFTDGIRVRPFSENPPYLSAFGSQVSTTITTSTITFQVEETSVIMNATLYNDSGYSNNSCGFIVSKTLPLDLSNYLYNASAGYGYNNTNRNFTASITGLTSGQYYYARSWKYNGTSYNISSLNYFLTKPYAPEYTRQTGSVGRYITVNLISPEVGTNTNYSVGITYNIDHTPTNRTDGTFLGNYSCTSGTDCSVNFYLPTLGSDYYVSFWSNINASGSPLLQQWSDSYDWTIINTSGGNYTFNIYYENSTYGSVNLSRYSPVQFNVYYNNRTEYNIFPSQIQSPIDYDLANGTIYLNTSITPLYFELLTNWETYYSCRRALVQHANQVNYSFYVITDRPTYGIGTLNINESLVPYTFSHLDKSGLFIDKGQLDAYTTFYTFNESGTKQIIHEEFWDTYDQVYPWLIPYKNYYIGVDSSDVSISRLGLAPNQDEVSSTIMIDPTSSSDIYHFNQFISYTAGRTSTNVYVHYLDTSYTITSSHIKIYYESNNTLAYSASSTLFVKNYTTALSGDYAYKWVLYINSTFDSLTKVLKGTIDPIIDSITTYNDMNNTLTTIFGFTPLHNVNGIVSWVSIIIVFVGLYILTSFTSINIGIAGLATSLWTAAAAIFISGMDPILLLTGVLIGIFSILYMYRGAT